MNALTLQRTYATRTKMMRLLFPRIRTHHNIPILHQNNHPSAISIHNNHTCNTTCIRTHSSCPEEVVEQEESPQDSHTTCTRPINNVDERRNTKMEKVKVTLTKSTDINNQDATNQSHDVNIDKQSSSPSITTTSSESLSAATTTTAAMTTTFPTPSLQTTNATQLVDSLLHYTSTLVNPNTMNIVAFSGGVDSSLVAALVHTVTTSTTSTATTATSSSHPNTSLAVIGVSPSLPPKQLNLARSIAEQIGIPLKEVSTDEGTNQTYIQNEGQACFVCKTHLYSALNAVAGGALEYVQNMEDIHYSQHDHSPPPSPQKQHSQQQQQQQQQQDIPKAILYNGTNADDTKDPTRLGLLAATNFSVQSPLRHIPKSSVRIAAQHLSLPNWNYAASPCLRSRLALGMEATELHLRAVDQAEEMVRGVLDMDDTVNMRVRMLSGKRAMVELDPLWVVSGSGGGTSSCTSSTGSTGSNNSSMNASSSESMTKEELKMAERIEILSKQLRQEGVEQFVKDLGFIGGMGVRPFKSGSVSTRKEQ